uniref:Uncharacterized protein n=1 Tax=Candidatus Kentrum sp. SD TaxID=2126332 RepID=A0A450YGB2_9GAMM|nr:MAG: hypothetical protein BECKSD772F_GA0070984_106317 [Candidatus Kentron sp. SD]VFK45685.1 MAG: hypothetical protein BECKSD772E_GA0070983_105817 [Candidatus Kentron sp. SD]
MDFLLALFFLLAGCAALLDSYLPDERVAAARGAVLAWWEGFRRQRPERLTQQASREFNRLFDALYGEKHFSWRTLRRSLVFSVFGFLVTALVCEWIAPGYLAEVYERGAGMFLLFIGNLLADYVSLLETRLVLRRCAASRAARLPVWLALDVLASYLLYVFVGVSFVFLLLGLLGGEGLELFYPLFTLDFHLDNLSLLTHIKWSTAFLYSTFFTSFLFYLFVLASLLLRLLGPLRSALMPLMRWLSTARHPVKSFVSLAGGVALLIEGARWMMA